jgi:flavin reductase (DIM6/NTAB) family NADH-FMN oxidoreductase RutF
MEPVDATAMSPEPETEPATFGAFIAHVDRPMILVTVVAGDAHAGCLVGFHAQSSIDPGRYTVWISKANRTLRIALLANTFGIHFLERDNRDLAELFGTRTGDEADKFAECDWTTGRSGLRLLTGCRARVTASRVAMHDDGGDHVGFVLEPDGATAPSGFEPLLFSDVQAFEAGHAADERQTPKRSE